MAPNIIIQVYLLTYLLTYKLINCLDPATADNILCLGAYVRNFVTMSINLFIYNPTELAGKPVVMILSCGQWLWGIHPAVGRGTRFDLVPIAYLLSFT